MASRTSWDLLLLGNVNATSAYCPCVGLGYGPAIGAELLSIMLGFGVMSRLIFGLVSRQAW